LPGEIAQCSLNLQQKLLRVREEREGISRALASPTPASQCATLLAATNADVNCRGRRRRFRQDTSLSDKIPVEIHIPPQARPPRGIGFLAQHFSTAIRAYAQKYFRIRQRPDHDFMRLPGRGNVAIGSRCGNVRTTFPGAPSVRAADSDCAHKLLVERLAGGDGLDEVEATDSSALSRGHEGNVSQAAKARGLSRRRHVQTATQKMVGMQATLSDRRSSSSH